MPRQPRPIQPELFKPQYLSALETPIGKAWVESDGERITRVTFRYPGPGRNTRPPKVLKEAVLQLAAYFAGRRKKFDLPLYLVGSPYRQQVWKRLQQVRFGETATFAQVAADVGGAANSISSACEVNPLQLLVPCHRVIGSTGLLTSYADGLWRKKWLLQHEGALPVD